MSLTNSFYRIHFSYTRIINDSLGPRWTNKDKYNLSYAFGCGEKKKNMCDEYLYLPNPVTNYAIFEIGNITDDPEAAYFGWARSINITKDLELVFVKLITFYFHKCA